jgi:hypothetical protein
MTEVKWLETPDDDGVLEFALKLVCVVHWESPKNGPVNPRLGSG